MNGVTDHGDRPISPKAYLGKRKRISSPDTNTESLSKKQITSTQHNFEDILHLMRKYDPDGHILKQKLPLRPDEPSLKRQRTTPSNAPMDNIEFRLLNNTYKSMNELMADISYLKDEFDQDDQVDCDTAFMDAIRNILSSLNNDLRSLDLSMSTQTNGTHRPEDDLERSAAQVLSLRSQTETGIRQLFSGLPHSTNGSVPDINGRKLPNGFELTAVTMMDRSKKQNKDNRTFGEVFAPHRNTKTLEAPRPDRRNRDMTTLSFIQPHTGGSSTTKSDYRYEKIYAGSWLDYSAEEFQIPSSGKKPKIKRDGAMSLFKAAFTSFAPANDHIRSVATDADRSRSWWQKYANMNTILDLPETSKNIEQGVETSDLHLDDNFEEMLKNYISESDLDDRDESEKLLSEISELLETLSSYQLIRDSEHARGPSSANKPTKAEVDVYEILKSQLQILISDLPPYAVAKLKGDQLEALNISTTLLVTPPEFSGTSHADEYTLRRVKAAQVATTAVARPNPVGATRNNYATPASAYNTQAYNRNAPATAYAARQSAATYNTPRTAPSQSAPYTQSNYRAASAAYPNSTIQQFQRAMANGLTQPGTPTAQSYTQRPPQASPQQRHQDNTTPYAGGDSSHATLMNGQLTQNEQASHANTASASQAELNQRMTESMRLLQQQSAQTRQASGTPQPSNGTNVAQQQAMPTGAKS